MDESFPQKLKKAVEQNRFTNLVGYRPLEVREGYAKVQVEVRDEHLNIHGTGHGALIFGVLDEAFQLASNSHGTSAVALTVTVNYLRPAKKGDTLFGEAIELDKTRRTGNYKFVVTNQNGELVAHGQGMVYRKDDQLLI
jgi:acyl-CoA thioesterase